VPLELGRRDPVMAMLREHLQAEPLPRGQRALIARFSLAGASGEAPSPAAAALWLDTKRAYLELRPQLRRMYVPAVAPENRRLMFDGRAVELSPLELDLLVHLRRREGVIVTRRELPHEVWGHQWTDGSSNVVEASPPRTLSGTDYR
jgi:Transcriptional regulatory protein, C terminal